MRKKKKQKGKNTQHINKKRGDLDSDDGRALQHRPSKSSGYVASQQCGNSDGQKDEDGLWFDSTMRLESECD